MVASWPWIKAWWWTCDKTWSNWVSDDLSQSFLYPSPSLGRKLRLTEDKCPSQVTQLARGYIDSWCHAPSFKARPIACQWLGVSWIRSVDTLWEKQEVGIWHMTDALQCWSLTCVWTTVELIIFHVGDRSAFFLRTFPSGMWKSYTYFLPFWLFVKYISFWNPSHNRCVRMTGRLRQMLRVGKNVSWDLETTGTEMPPLLLFHTGDIQTLGSLEQFFTGIIAQLKVGST